METLLKQVLARSPDGDVNALSPEERRKLLREYVESVMGIVGEYNRTSYSLLGRSMYWPTSKKAKKAAADRVQKIKNDPHEMELLLGVLDARLPARIKMAQTADYNNYETCTAARVVGLMVAGCGLLLNQSFGSDLFGPVFMGFGALGVVYGTALDLVKPYGRLKQAIFRREANRAMDRYLVTAAAKGQTSQAWEKWKFTTEALGQVSRDDVSAEEEIKNRGIRLLNASGFLHALTVEQLPTGERFESVFKEGAKVSRNKLAELVTLVDQRLEQLETVRSDLDHTRLEAQKSLDQLRAGHVTGEDPGALAIMNQVAVAQARAADQLIVSASTASAHLKNIRNLTTLAESGQNEQSRIEDEIRLLNETLEKSNLSEGSETP